MFRDFLNGLLGVGGSEYPQAPPHDEDAIRIATCVLLLETATEDGEFDVTERRHIADILSDRFELSAEEVTALIGKTREARKQAVDLWEFTNHLNQNLSREDKEQVLSGVWKVVYADGTLERAEDRLAHKFGKLLRVRHDEVIEIKVAVRKEMQA